MYRSRERCADRYAISRFQDIIDLPALKIRDSLAVAVRVHQSGNDQRFRRSQGGLCFEHPADSLMGSRIDDFIVIHEQGGEEILAGAYGLGAEELEFLNFSLLGVLGHEHAYRTLAHESAYIGERQAVVAARSGYQLTVLTLSFQAA